MQQFGLQRAPGLAVAPRQAQVDAGVARRHTGQTVGQAVGGKAFEPLLDEQVKALRVVLLQLDAAPVGMQKKPLALVKVERQHVIAVAGLAVGRAFKVGDHAQPRAARHRQDVGQRLQIGVGMRWHHEGQARGTQGSACQQAQKG